MPLFTDVDWEEVEEHAKIGNYIELFTIHKVDNPLLVDMSETLRLDGPSQDTQPTYSSQPDLENEKTPEV